VSTDFSMIASLVVLALVVGALGGVHVPINGALGARLDSAVFATLVFYTVALVTTGVVALFTVERSSIASLASTPAWLYVLPGLISVAVVGSSTWLIPRLGAVNVFVLAVCAQTVVRVVISHFGWLSSPVDPISAPKVMGAVMVAAGAVLVVRS